jgi:hypothetical protein
MSAYSSGIDLCSTVRAPNIDQCMTDALAMRGRCEASADASLIFNSKLKFTDAINDVSPTPICRAMIADNRPADGEKCIASTSLRDLFQM